ncbi:MAG TPA: hypothetical protein VFM57_01140 [Thermoleophilaceae bacterium]|nr:hypothetical protein [Thermoleophilaceae bacterium]
MAELTELEEKVAEVYGLAQAAQNATQKIKGLVENDEIEQTREAALTLARQEA